MNPIKAEPYYTLTTLQTYESKDGYRQVIVEFRYQAGRCRLSTPFKIHVDLIKTASPLTLKGGIGKKILEETMAMEKRLHKIAEELLDEGTKPVPKLVKKLFQEKVLAEEKDADLKGRTIIDWYREFIEQNQSQWKSSFHHHSRVLRYIKEFQKHDPKINFSLEQLYRDWWEAFRDFLLTEKEFTATHVQRILRFTKQCIRWVEEDERNTHIKVPKAYRKKYCIAKYPKPLALSLDELVELNKLDLSDNVDLQNTRDAFVLGVAIGGLRHSDLRNLTVLDIYQLGRSYFIDFIEQKTGNEHRQKPLNDLALSILSKYGMQLPFVACNNRFNLNLKAIARQLKWHLKFKQIPEYSASGSLKVIHKKTLAELLTSKWMRKTKTSIDLALGVPLAASMDGTGHKSLSSYSHYADATSPQTRQDVVKRWNDALKSKGSE
jgi:integrase